MACRDILRTAAIGAFWTREEKKITAGAPLLGAERHDKFNAPAREIYIYKYIYVHANGMRAFYVRTRAMMREPTFFGQYRRGADENSHRRPSVPRGTCLNIKNPFFKHSVFFPCFIFFALLFKSEAREILIRVSCTALLLHGRLPAATDAPTARLMDAGGARGGQFSSGIDVAPAQPARSVSASPA